MIDETVYGPPRPAVLDEKHLGDIEGALGRLRWRETRSVRAGRKRLLAFAAIAGPGLIALVANNDAGSIATYGEAGQDHGVRMLWALGLLLPILFVVQEMAARLGAVSGVGHARLIRERFGRAWGTFAVTDLVILNLLTLVTEFIGVRLAAEYLGLPPAPALLLAAALLIGVTCTGSFRRWERAMFVLLAVNAVVIPLALMTHSDPRAVFLDGIDPGIPDGLSPTTALLVVALVGTTLAPWQYFFQQSAVIDKHITPRWLNYARVDIAVGALLMVGGAAVVMVLSSAAVHGSPLQGHFSDAGALMRVVGSALGGAAGKLLAILLIDGALLGAAAVTLSTAYAVGDVAGAPHSLHRSPRTAPLFHGMVATMIAVSAAMVLVPGIPLGRSTLVVQALTGLLLPSAAVFLLLLCNDTAVLGPWVNPRWLNVLASLVITAMLAVSGLAVAASMLPSGPMAVLLPVVLGTAGGALACIALLARRPRRGRRRRPALAVVQGAPGRTVVLPRRAWGRASPRDHERWRWRMPPLEELKVPVASPARTVVLLLLRTYVLLCVVLLLAHTAGLVAAGVR